MSSHRLFAAICVALLPLTAAAVPMTYEFSGQVSFASGSSPPGGEVFVPIIPFGTDFSGYFTYESETPVAVEAAGLLGYIDPITGASISFGAGGALGVYNFAAKPIGANTSRTSVISFVNDLALSGNPPFDQFNMTTALGNAPGDPASMYRFLSFTTGDNSAQQLPPGQTLLDPLPVDAFLSGFHQLSFGYSVFNDAGEEFDSAIGSQQIQLALVPVSVPEPDTLPILGVGLAGIWMMTRRRVRVAQRPTVQ